MKKNFLVLLMIISILLTNASFSFTASAVDQLTTLQNWYNAMNPLNTNINLFSDDISYLTVDHNSNVNSFSTWPQWKTMQNSYSWSINSSTASQNYYINIAVKATANTVLKVTDGSNYINYTMPHTGTNKYEMGQLYIPAGVSTITLSFISGTNTDEVINLELIPASAKPTIDAQIAASQARPSWMKDNSVGVMYQWGEWGCNSDGSHATWPGCYANMNWDSFAQKLQDTHVDFLVWSLDWNQMYVAAPISSIESVLPGSTTISYGGHDYLMDILNACNNRGIKVVFYFNPAWDMGSTGWWQNMYVADLPSGNNALKYNFMNRWMNIVGEIGTRYGTKLAGWMFDYSNSYNPGPLKMFTDVSRQGNANRLVTFNCANDNSVGGDMYGPAFTPFQDYYMGEATYPGQPNLFGSDIPFQIVNGRYTDGPFKNMQAFSCFPAENGGDTAYGSWAINRFSTNYPITTKYSQDQFNSFTTTAALQGQATAFNLMMWEDGTGCQANYDRIKIAADLAHSCVNNVNDTSANISYSGTWNYSTNRGVGDYSNDVHYSNTNGNYFQYTFNGTGVDVIMPKDPGEGNVDIYIDGVFQQTVNTYNASYMAQQTIYTTRTLTNGLHTLKVVKNSGTYMQVDSIKTFAPPAVNDTNTSIAYTGSSWGYATNRGASDFGDDIHYATTTGDYCQYSFTGSGISVIMPKSSSQGNVDVYIDGAFQQTVNTYISSGYLAQQTVYSNNSLSFGSHTIKCIKATGSYMQLDAFKISYPTNRLNDNGDSGFTYNGTWSYSSNRGVGDYCNDLHYTYTNGNYIQYTFNGTGVDLIMPKEPGQGNVDIYIDGVFMQTVNTYYASYLAQQQIYSTRNLASGSHTIKVVKNSGSYMQFDDLYVY
jgi:hypothetical protein